MELHQVRYFVALCQTLNFTRAAEACNVTQPALTRAIQRLEDELGGGLFQRERNLTQLTELGRLMRPLLEQTIAAAESAKENAARFRRSELAGLRIGLPADISARLIAAPLREMIRRIPKLEIELKMAEKEQMAEGLLQGEIDTAFLDDSIELPDRLNAWPLFQEGYQLAFPAAHRFAKLNGLGLEALDGEVLLCRHSSIAASLLQQLCHGAGSNLSIRRISESEEHVQQLVAIELGIALLPVHISALPPLLTRPLANTPLQRSVVLCAVAGRRYSPALDVFLRLARASDFASGLNIAA